MLHSIFSLVECVASWWKGRKEYKKEMKEDKKIKRRRSIGFTDEDKADFVMRSFSSKIVFEIDNNKKSRRATSVVPNLSPKQKELLAPRKKGKIVVRKCYLLL